ncbi:MAG TPA: AraC family transcriptional regulator [Clostridia bacterium]|nr:AraC family transcriptional regulator [Clostridia bacterium]
MQDADYTEIIPDIEYFVNRKCTPGWNIIRSTIDFHDLTYVYGGRSVYIVNGEEYKLQQGDLIYIPSGNVREAYTFTEDPIQSFAANFHIHNPGDSSDDAVLPFDRVMKLGISADLISLYSELDHIWVEKSYNYKMRARAYFMLILDKLLNRVASGLPMQQEDERLAGVKQHILKNYMNKIELNQLAAIAGLNPVYLGAYFKKANGCSIKQYITRIRVNNAESLLSTGGYTVGEAAMRSGFDDLFYFSKVFRNYKGYAPSVLLKGKSHF